MAIIMRNFIFILLFLSAAVFAPVKASETVVWSGDTAISWNQDIYVGVQFETALDLFAGLAKDDTIKGSVVAHIDEPQYVITYKAGDQWSWTDINDVTVADGLMSYIVPDETIANEIATRGLVFRGQGYNITQIAIASKGQEPGPGPEPEPVGPYVDREVWTGDVAISWNQEVYAGTEFDTYTAQADMLAGLQEGDSIKIFYAEAIEGAQFALTYKAGSEWTWTDLTVTEADGFFAYKVASEELAMDIADHGLVVRGQGYHLTHIVIGTPKNAEGIETISPSQGQSQKLIRNGQLIIIRNGIEYTINGQIVQ